MLVCLGDSITAAEGAWPDLVPVETVNLAKVGAVIADLRKQVARAPTARAAVVSIGTNHIVVPGGPTEWPDLPLAVEELRARFERVAFLPVLHRDGGGGPWRDEFVDRRRLFVAALGRCDAEMLPFNLARWQWRRDNMHPNPLGQRRIAREVMRWFQERPSRLSHR